MPSNGNYNSAQNNWINAVDNPRYRAWTGYAFEAICYKHVSQIRVALQIDAGSEVGSWRFVPKKGQAEDGAQIDLLFDRPDGAITICEIKYNEQPYAIDKQYAKNLMNKADVYKKHKQKNKEIFIAMITSSGLKPTMYSEDIIAGQVVLDDLFKG